MTPHEQAAGWCMLGANAHLKEIQEVIRREIAKGRIRVITAPNDGIRIIPMDGHAAPAMPRSEPIAVPAVVVRSLPAKA
jgi:hypothetical protein